MIEPEVLTEAASLLEYWGMTGVFCRACKGTRMHFPDCRVGITLAALRSANPAEPAPPPGSAAVLRYPADFDEDCCGKRPHAADCPRCFLGTVSFSWASGDHTWYDRNRSRLWKALREYRKTVVPESAAFVDTEKCQRCGGQNICWFINSELWNRVMRGDGPGKNLGIVCMHCFVALASEQGIETPWQLLAEFPVIAPDDFAARLEAELDRWYKACEDHAATPSSILLAVLNAVAAARMSRG